MCRTNGRKCYHNWNQEQRNADLARRRAIYAAKKGGAVRTYQNYQNQPKPVFSSTGVMLPPETTHAGTIATEQTSSEAVNLITGNVPPTVNPLFTSPVIKIKGKDVSQGEAFSKDSTPVAENTALGIELTKNKGVLVENEYFAEHTVRGQINYWNLSEESRTSLGFKALDPEKGASAWNGEFDVNDYDELSKVELENIPHEQQMALRYFTSNNYRWMNDILYNPDDPEKEETAPPGKVMPDDFFSTSPKEKHYDTFQDEVPKNKESLEKITKIIDTALHQHSPHQQRIVYRGMSAWNNAFTRYAPGLEGYGSRDKWLDDHIVVGQEIQFDGYQSSSLSYNSAKGYCQGGGVLYEILTPEGVNVTSVSQYREEQEVLLPRNARYMVVSRKDNVRIGSYNDDLATIVSLVAINSKGEVLDGTNADYQLGSSTPEE